MLYELYKKTLRKYRPENICFMGGSSGGNLAIGMASYINDRGEGLPMPRKENLRYFAESEKEIINWVKEG